MRRLNCNLRREFPHCPEMVMLRDGSLADGLVHCFRREDRIHLSIDQLQSLDAVEFRSNNIASRISELQIRCLASSG